MSTQNFTINFIDFGLEVLLKFPLKFDEKKKKRCLILVNTTQTSADDAYQNYELL